MAEEPKPKASFMGGKSAAPATPDPAPAAAIPAAVPENAPGGDPQNAKPASFLKAKGPAPAPVPAPAPRKSGVMAAAKPAASAPAAASAQAAPAQPAPAATPVALAPGNREVAEQYLQQGLNFYDAQDVNNALVAYQQCIQADPSFGMGHNNLGMVLIDMERYEEAIAALYNSLRCDPNYAEAFNNLGFVLRRMQRPVEAVSAYERFLTLEPDVEEGPRIRQWMDTVLKEQNLAAPPPFQLPGTAPSKSAEPPPKLKKMAAWEAAAGNVATAAPVNMLGEIGGPVAQTPVQPSQVSPMPPPQKSPPPRSGGAAKPPMAGGAGSYIQLIEKGMDAFAEGNLENAVQLFQQAIDLDPNNAEGYTGLGKVLIRQEHLEEAVEQLHKAATLDPEDPSAWYVMGFALRALERNVEAAECYQNFLRMMPIALDAERMRQWIALVLGADAAGISDPIEEAADDEPISTETDQQYKAALDLFQSGDAASAERASVSILTADPGHYRTRLLLGRCYLRQKKLDAAIEQFQNVLISRPDYPEALYFIGQVHDKKGDIESTRENYQRYMDIAPTGPRAQRVEDWFLSRGQSKDGAAGEQIQCELCLRFFGKSEITQHEDKATCVNCMAVMGGAPMMVSPPSSQKAGALAVPEPSEGTQKEEVFTPAGQDSGKKKVILALAGVAALLAAAFFLGFLDPVLKMAGLGPKPKPKPPTQKAKDPEKDPSPGQGPFDFSKVKLTGDAPKIAEAFAQWTFTPKLENTEGLNDYVPDWSKTFTLSGGPQGMSIDSATGKVTWTPKTLDPENLKRGESYRAEITVKANGRPVLQPDTKELFTLTHSFTVGVQFGYELGGEMDLGLGMGDQPSISGGDFNSDGLPDAAVGTGQFRNGTLNLYIQRKNSPLATPTVLDKSGRFAAVATGDIDGDKHEDLLAAAWMTGKLRVFMQTGADLVAASETLVGPGPVAVALCDLDGDGKTETAAALLSSSSTLSVSTLDATGKMGAPSGIPLRGAGPKAWLFPWKSKEKGAGLLAVLPLAPSPIQFVPHNGGQWLAGGAATASAAESGSVIRAAAVLKSFGGDRLALILSTRTTSRIVVFSESNGAFTPSGQSTTLAGLGMGLLAHDFNSDGSDDLLAIEIEQLQFLFSKGEQWESGLKLKTPRMLGPAALLKSGKVRPDALLISESRKGYFLRAVINDPPPLQDLTNSKGNENGAPEHDAKAKTGQPGTSSGDKSPANKQDAKK